MDSKGNLYAIKAALGAMEETMRDAFMQTEELPANGPDFLAIDDEYVAAQLAGMNRRARMVYFSERRRGASERSALDAARESYR